MSYIGPARCRAHSDHGWNYENSNYMFNRFEVDSKEYQKFEAHMAQVMAEAKPAGNQ